MFNIGDMVVYSVHGLCKIDDICDKTIQDVTRTYYVLHPIDDSKLTISIPVNSDKVVILKMLEKAEAEEIIQSFKQPGIKWLEDVKQRYKKYHSLVKTGNRKEISQVVNTLMRKNNEASIKNKKLYDQDRKLLLNTQHVLFEELATTLDTSPEEIGNKINHFISQNE